MKKIPWWTALLPKRLRRRNLMASGLPRESQQYLRDYLPFVRSLTQEEIDRLFSFVAVFLREKRFEGCGGLVVNDDMKLAVAAEACRLVLNQQTPAFYPSVSSILLYPTTFVHTTLELSEAGTRRKRREALLGAAWSRDLVILAWDTCVRGIEDVRDGRNVVLHEFAHHLDLLSGSFDGVPMLSERQEYDRWLRVFQEAFNRHQEQTERGVDTFLDSYAATDVAEFFAVATEQFFEQGKRFSRELPELYQVLAAYYGQDPAQRASVKR